MKNNSFYFLFIFILLGAISCAPRGEAAVMTITSPAFKNNQPIPAKYACRGSNINPEFNISGIPEGAKSLVLIVDDPDAPMGMWVHWVVYDILPTPLIPEKSIPGTQGWNDFEQTNWGGPCPPSGTHRYFFKIYALDTLLGPVRGKMTKADVERLMRGHILAHGQLIGLYQKTN